MRPSVFCGAKQDRASARRSNARITAALAVCFAETPEFIKT
ncbi:MAG: hypothetical protein ACLULK_00965 [Anaerovoracaceae bacterium]